MARRKKQLPDPRQLSLFDLFATQAEELREEAREEDFTPLGQNLKGEWVYVQREDNARMHSKDPSICRFIDGEKDSPEELFRKRKHDFLTREELASFEEREKRAALNSLPLFTEAQHVGSSDSPIGNSQSDSEAGNNLGNSPEPAGLRPDGVSNSGSLGTQSTGRIEGSGGIRSADSPSVRAAGDGGGRAGLTDGGRNAVERVQQVGDSGSDGDRYPRENYRIPLGTIGVGGASVKLADNLRAIEQLKKLADNGIAVAGSEEKDILARYVGWGGLPQIFDPKHTAWAEQNAALRGMLSDAEYAKARRSTQDAHYTSETVIRSIYAGLERLGVGKDTAAPPLRILEPSVGIGNFIGLCPPALVNAHWRAIEQDAISAAIARYLYPKAEIITDGFQNVHISRQYFDVAVGNPPFGSQRLFDAKHPELRNLSIHNYFLAKSIAKLREGGIAAFVVSRFFMDAQDTSARERIAAQAEFLGAIRLPNSAFRQNALTDVTTDIVFFQRTDNPKNRQWIETETVKIWNEKDERWDALPVNSYFADHPEQMIGELRVTGGAFAKAINCVAGELDLGAEIEQRLAVLPQDVFTPHTAPATPKPMASETDADRELLGSTYFDSLKFGALCVEPRTGRIVQKVEGEMGAASYDVVQLKRDSEQKRLVGLIGIRDALRSLLNAEKDTSADDMQLTLLRRQLNQKYDAFIKRFGLLNSTANRAALRDDPEAALVQSLESKYDRGLSPDMARKTGKEPRKPSAVKAAIFSRRVLEPATLAASAETAHDAMLICLRESGKIVFSRIAELVGMAEDEARMELQRDGLIFLNPSSGDWEIREKYLSGNVREKLRQAQEAALEDARFSVNVSALEAAMPPDVEAVDIGVQFGASWVPAEDMRKFLHEVICGSDSRIHVKYLPQLGKWDAKVSIFDASRNSSIWGIPEYPATRLIESLLRGTPIKIEKETGRDSNGNPIMTLDSELTAAAMQKADEIKKAFQDWIWTDDERRQRLTALYNERFNTHVPPSYDGSHITLTHANPDVKLRPHQKSVIWRGIQEGTALFDHVVGAGKTLACIATVMESKRMGFVKKPMIVVPNHLLFQWRDEFYKLYPDAKILVADKTDFEKKNRERFFSRVATGDWDAVVVAHSSFRKIEMPAETLREILTEQIESAMQAISEAKDEQGSRATIKQLEKQRERLEQRYNELIAKGGEKDQAVDFADLGVDALFVDESQEFKNLAFQTTMNVSGLGNVTGSAKALDLFVKCRYLQRKNEGRGVFFLTGTPISNSISEVYTLQRYLQYDELVKKEVNHFDAWASTYGQITNGWELDATGVNYKLKSRFAKFQNVPELLSMYRTFADVVTKSDLDAQAKQAGHASLTPPVKGGAPQNIVAERSPAQAEYMTSIIHRMEHLPRDPRQDNPLKITNDARKAGLDYRLIEADAEDFAGSKTNLAVERIWTIWRDTADVRGTQLVFCDLSTPKKLRQAERPEELTACFDVDETNIEAADDDDVVVSVSMDEQLAAQGDFSVYDDMRRKLVQKGIPEEEIAFIHEANTDLRKSKLFADMNAGNVRILLGSTSKMGAGTNVQERLVAAHHLDAPWRPSDLEQRNGRIIRQGNKLYEDDRESFQVEIYYYATKQTYDARMWQTIEYKAAAIEQFRKGDLLQRVIDDVQSEAATAAEMKAAASGNPLILMQVQLASELRKLEGLHSQHQRTQFRLRDRLKYLQDADSRLDAARSIYEASKQLRDGHTRYDVEKGQKKVHVELVAADGKLLDGETDKKKINELFAAAIREVPRSVLSKGLPVGRYRGFDIAVLQPQADSKFFQFTLSGAGAVRYPTNLRYSFGESFSLSGFFQRVDNVLDKHLDQGWQDAQTLAEQERAELKTAVSRIGEAFPQADEFELTRRNHDAVMRELKRMQDEAGYVSEWRPMTLDELRAERLTGGSPAPVEGQAQAEDGPPAEERNTPSTIPRGLVFSKGRM